MLIIEITIHVLSYTNNCLGISLLSNKDISGYESYILAHFISANFYFNFPGAVG